MTGSQEDYPDPLVSALEAFRHEYADLAATWRDLDGKAQGVATIAGVFLAAAFAFVRDIKSLFPSPWTRAGLIVAIVLFLTAVVLCIMALRIRPVSMAPAGTPVSELADDLIAVADRAERAARMPAFISDQSRLWRHANDDLRMKGRSKASFLLSAQYTLLGAIGMLALLTIILIAGGQR